MLLKDLETLREGKMGDSGNGGAESDCEDLGNSLRRCVGGCTLPFLRMLPGKQQQRQQLRNCTPGQ